MEALLALAILTAGAGAIWAGITDPAGGIPAAVQALMTGQPITKRERDPSTFLAGLGTGAVMGAAGGLKAGVALDNLDPAAAAGTRAAVIAEAQTWTGVPYRWGGNTRAGVDCSGFTKAVYKTAAGINLPRVSSAQALTGRPTSTPQPGDLVAFGTPVHHVGIYLGPDKMIHAPRSGRTVGIEAIWHTERVQYRDVLGTAPAPSTSKQSAAAGNPRTVIA